MVALRSIDPFSELDVYVDDDAEVSQVTVMRTVALLEPARRRQRHYMPPEGRAKADAYPEYATYVDDGCSLAPACLACPFERCRYEEALGSTTIRVEQRSQRAQALRNDGASIAEIAHQLGISRRAVFRYFERASRGPVMVTRYRCPCCDHLSLLSEFERVKAPR